MEAVMRKETSIHPTALVHPGARLGRGVQIGPFSIVEAGAEIFTGWHEQNSAFFAGKAVLESLQAILVVLGRVKKTPVRCVLERLFFEIPMLKVHYNLFYL